MRTSTGDFKTVTLTVFHRSKELCRDVEHVKNGPNQTLEMKNTILEMINSVDEINSRLGIVEDVIREHKPRNNHHPITQIPPEGKGKRHCTHTGTKMSIAGDFSSLLEDSTRSNAGERTAKQHL